MASTATEPPPKPKLFALFHKKPVPEPGAADAVTAQPPPPTALAAVPKKRRRAPPKTSSSRSSKAPDRAGGGTQLQLDALSLRLVASSSTAAAADDAAQSPAVTAQELEDTIEDDDSRTPPPPSLPLTPATPDSAASEHAIVVPRTLTASPAWLSAGSKEAPVADDEAVIELSSSPPPVAFATPRTAHRGSRQRPIEIADSSPTPAQDVRASLDRSPPPPPQPRKAVHSFFARRAPVVSAPQKVPLAACWPDASMQHVRAFEGPDAVSTRATAAFTRRKRLAPFRPIEEEPLPPLLGSAAPVPFLLPPRFDSLYVADSSNDQVSHPLLDYVSTHPAPSTAIWCEHYRPVKAEHVLGNEEHALYLKAWLQTHQLRLESQMPGSPLKQAASTVGRPKRQVIRAVGPKRKRRRVGEDSEDEWLVSDDGEDYEPPSRGGRDDDNYEPAELSIADTAFVTEDERFQRLTNLIILTGACGSGKSAAAHACATELGWSVFEIHPGIGKRSGANIVSLVGDAASNHVLRLGKDHGFDALSIQDEGTPAPAGNAIQQSLFLFDEADVVFRDDVGFWPALVNLVADSRRPVILTCNDVSLIPVDELPVQAVLHFQPCGPALASVFLRTIAQVNGFGVDDGTARRMYGAVDSPSLARGDLRHAISTLQMWAAARETTHTFPSERIEAAAEWADAGFNGATQSITSSANVDAEIEHCDRLDLIQLDRLASDVSAVELVEAQIARTGEQSSEMDTSERSIGHAELCAGSWEDAIVLAGSHDRQQQMLSLAAQRSRFLFEGHGAGARIRGAICTTGANLFPGDVDVDEHYGHIATVVAGLVPVGTVPQPTRTAAALDIVPVALSIVRADDILEAAHATVGSEQRTVGRVTRRKRLASYERYIAGPVTAAARALALVDRQ